MQQVVGGARHDVLLGQHLDAIGNWLEKSKWPGASWTRPILYAAEDLAFEQRRGGERSSRRRGLRSGRGGRGRICWGRRFRRRSSRHSFCGRGRSGGFCFFLGRLALGREPCINLSRLGGMDLMIVTVRLRELVPIE